MQSRTILLIICASISPHLLSAQDSAAWDVAVKARYGWTSMEEADRPLTQRERQLSGGVLGGIEDIAVGEDGTLWVLDARMSKVVGFNRDGSLRTVFGGKGQGPGEFDAPIAIAVGANGHVYILDRALRIVSEMTGDGVHVRSIPVPSARDLAIGDNELWIARSGVAAGAPLVLGIDLRSGETVDSGMPLMDAEVAILRAGGPVNLATNGARSAIYAAGPLPGMWRLHVNGSTRTRGSSRFPDARALMLEMPTGVRARTTNVRMRGFDVAPDGSAVSAYDYKPEDSPNQEFWLEHSSPVGVSLKRYKAPLGVFLNGVAVDGQDLLVGVTSEVPQVWRVILHPDEPYGKDEPAI